MKTVSVLSFACNVPTGPPLYSYQILSNMSKGIQVMERTRMLLRTDAMLIAISPEPTGRGIKIFQSVIDLNSGHEINAKSLSNITKGDNAKSKKGKVVILVRDTSSHPVLQFYQVPPKYSEGYSSYRADTKSISNKTKEN